MSDTTPTAPSPPGRVALTRDMARHWWLFLVRGVAAILFGVFTFLAPGVSLFFILAFLAAWLAVDGLATLWQAVRGTPGRSGFWFWADGLLSLAAAAFLILSPGVSSFVLVLVVGAWTLALGVLRVIAAFQLRSVLLGLFGALTVVIGAWLIAQPGLGLLALVWFVGLEAMVAGALLIGLGWRLRRIGNDPPGAGGAAAPTPAA
jgi:uncharacterized membrane protein HdeD (DUF308 family)